MTVAWSLLDLDRALRESWAADTCSPDDQPEWHPENPAWGHCDITALLVNDIFGGDLLVAEVHVDGAQRGFHWWNRLSSGVDLDLTREQFQRGQTIGTPRVIERPPGPSPRRWSEYLLLRERVSTHLGPLPGIPDVHCSLDEHRSTEVGNEQGLDSGSQRSHRPGTGL